MERTMTDNRERQAPLTEKRNYEKPVVETEEVLERQVLGTGTIVGDPKCP
jgi:hypothetical protein